MWKYTNYSYKPTLLWWIKARLQTVEELIKAQLPVRVLIRELNKGINTQAPGKNKHTCKHANGINMSSSIQPQPNINTDKHTEEMMNSLGCLIPHRAVGYASVGPLQEALGKVCTFHPDSSDLHNIHMYVFVLNKVKIMRAGRNWIMGKVMQILLIL